MIDVYNQGVISYAVGGWDPPFGIALVADPLSALLVLFGLLFALLITGIGSLVVLYSIFYFFR